MSKKEEKTQSEDPTVKPDNLLNVERYRLIAERKIFGSTVYEIELHNKTLMEIDTIVKHLLKGG